MSPTLLAMALPALTPRLVLPVLGVGVLITGIVFVWTLIKNHQGGGNLPLLNRKPKATKLVSPFGSFLTHFETIAQSPYAHLAAAALAERVEQVGKNTGHAALNQFLGLMGLGGVAPVVDKVAGNLETALAQQLAAQAPTQPTASPTAPVQPQQPSVPGGLHVIVPTGHPLEDFFKSFLQIRKT